MANDESIKLIREHIEELYDKKPSEILRWAAKHPDKIKHITGTLNNNSCGYCAKGIIGQVAHQTHLGNTDYYYSDPKYPSRVFPSADNPMLDIKYLYYKKYGKPLQEVTERDTIDPVIKSINKTIIELNDRTKASLDDIADFLENNGL